MIVRIEGENAAVVFTSSELRQVIRSLRGMVPRNSPENDTCIRLATKMLFGQRGAHQEMVDRVDKLITAAAIDAGVETEGSGNGSTEKD